MVIANVVLVFGTFLVASVGYWQGLTAVHTLDLAINTFNDDTARLNKAEDDKNVYDWQKFMVYTILADGYLKQKEPLDFEYIKSEYLKAAQQQIENANTERGAGPAVEEQGHRRRYAPEIS